MENEIDRPLEICLFVFLYEINEDDLGNAIEKFALGNFIVN